MAKDQPIRRSSNTDTSITGRTRPNHSPTALEQVPVHSELPLAASATVAFDTNQLGQRANLLLRGIVPLISQSSKLQAEVYSTLDEINMSVDDILCSGN